MAMVKKMQNDMMKAQKIIEESTFVGKARKWRYRC